MATVTIEPVAWRYRQYETYDWDTSYDPAEMKPFIAEFPSWQAGPLFTSEALAQARAEGKAEGTRWRTDVEDDGVHACHVEAARFDHYVGEWVVGIILAPPGKPWTHWRHLGAMPDGALPSPPADGETKL